MSNLAAVVHKIHRKLGDPRDPSSFSSKRRAFRFKEFLRRFPDLESMRVLDLGGTPGYWHGTPVRPAHVTTVNLDDFDPGAPWVEHVIADACDIATLKRCPGDYHLVVSNSLIEHVGGYQRRRDLAGVIRAAAPSHWVQTPDRLFPVEPHYVGPMFQFLPLRLRAQVVRRWPLNHVPVETADEALEQVLTIELISATELQFLFPESTIWHERLAGVSKSIVAVKNGQRS